MITAKKKTTIKDIRAEMAFSCKLGGRKFQYSSSADLAAKIRIRLNDPRDMLDYWNLLEGLRISLNYSPHQFAKALSISRTTLDRANGTKALSTAATNRVHRLISLCAKAIHYFTTTERAAKWMDTEIPALGGRTPKEIASAEPGTESVINLLSAMEDGAYA